MGCNLTKEVVPQVVEESTAGGDGDGGPLGDHNVEQGESTSIQIKLMFCVYTLF